jgi:Domain of unknown function (DUF4388)/Type II secretion system (T2SS), protein G
MALQGTLQDFGIAEILQLIGQQAKSGVLHLEAGDEEIHIQMADGCVVSAEYAGRRQRDRLGAMLVRAGLLARADLDRALEAQRRTLRRLGDLLVEMGLVAKDDLREMTALQTTETVYRLFAWKSGTYAFEPGEVEWDAETVTPLRAESLLMEGFRRVDEWPIVRRKISSPAMTFRRGAAPDAAAGALGPNERRVLALAVPGCTVETIVDRSRVGEFEACKALLGLVNAGLLEAIAPSRAASAGVTAYARSWRERLGRAAASLAATAAIAAAVAAVAWLGGERASAAEHGARALDDRAAERFLARYEVARLTAALDVYRLERGEYPARLDALVEAGLATRADLRYPWGEDYHYRRKADGGFVLLPPLP